MKVHKEGPRYWIGLHAGEFRENRAIGSFNVRTFKGKFNLEFIIQTKDITQMIYVPAKKNIDEYIWIALRDDLDITVGPNGKAIGGMVEHF